MPFHGQDAWRRHPLFNRLWTDPLPGFKYAVLVFGTYMVAEYTYRITNYYINAPPPTTTTTTYPLESKGGKKM